MLAKAAGNEKGDRILLGLYDLGSGLDLESVTVTADRPLAGIAAGENLFAKFQAKADGIWELKLDQPLAASAITLSVKDRRGNVIK